MYLILFIGVFLIWFLQSFLLRKLWDKNLSVSVRFQDSYIYEGEQSALKEIVANDKLLPVPAISVRLAMSRNLLFLNEAKDNSAVSDQTYKRDIFSFLFHQQVTRTLRFTGKKRGCYQIHSVDITAYDCFFHPCSYHTMAQDAQMYIFPAQVNANRISIICSAISGMILSRNRLHPDPFEFSGIRAYQTSDPMNRINWKASSRTGELMVNQYDSTTNMDVTILFDIEDPYILKYEELVEETIRIISSLAARLIRQKMPVRIISNALDPDSREAFYDYYPAGAGKIDKLNQKLACLDTNVSAFSCTEMLKKEAHPGTGEQTYILVSKNVHEELTDAVKQLAAPDRQLLWIIPVRSWQEYPRLAIPYVKILPWEVES